MAHEIPDQNVTGEAWHGQGPVPQFDDPEQVAGQRELETYAAIGEEGGTEALALVATIMEHNAAARERTWQQLYESEIEAHARTIEKLSRAEERLAQAQDRMARLFDFDPDYWGVER